MCEPVTIGTMTITATQMAMAGMAAASTAASMYTQDRAAAAQNEATKDAYNAQMAQLGQQQRQQQQAAEQQKSVLARETLKQRAQIATIAGEYGGGNTAARLDYEAAASGADNRSMTDFNTNNQLAQNYWQGESMRRGAIASMAPRVNRLSAGLSILNSGMTTMNTMGVFDAKPTVNVTGLNKTMQADAFNQLDEATRITMQNRLGIQ